MSNPLALFPSSNNPLIESLNPEQREAVGFLHGPLLVLAGAGSGKTRVLTTRIVHLIEEQGVPPERILSVTFTNKAAQEMRERVTGMLGSEPKGLWMGTFHSIGARILRRHAPQLGWARTFSIFDADQSLREVKRSLEVLDLDPKRWSPKALRGVISDAKNALVTPERFAQENGESFDFFLRTAARVYPEYEKGLKDQNAFDFDDLLTRPVELFDLDPSVLSPLQERFAFILVDEYQDTNRAQFRILEQLSAVHRNLMVVGDDDQSIYGWRGADIRNILDFEKTFPDAHVIRLEQNYRSSARILEAANAVISENTERKGKTLRTDREAGDRLILLAAADETDEAREIVDDIEARLLQNADLTARDFAILYRTNAQSRALEDAFRRRGLPYQIIGGVRFYERREIQDVLGYLRLISNPLDVSAFERVVNYPRRGIGNTSLARLVEWAAAAGLPPLEAARRAPDAPAMTPGGGRALQEFAALIDRYSRLASEIPVGELVQALVEELELSHHLRQDGPEGDDRIENVKELIAGALDFDGELALDPEVENHGEFSELDLFLQRVSLVADVDNLDRSAEAVTLMTLHNAKGLEFPVVYIGGLEDGLFPLSRAYDEPALMEEERRLFYVGVTRAKDALLLCHARQRRRAGEIMYGRLSPFVQSIPESLLEERKSTRARREALAFRPREPRARERRDPADQRIDYYHADPDMDLSLNQDLPRMVKGERVEHDTFGGGSVVEVTGFGQDLKVTVDFDSIGRKKLLVRYAALRKEF